MDVIYLDNNATTKPTAEAAAAVDEANRELWANPSSVHRFGQAVRQRLELARVSVASLIGAKPRELVFTSGGTESNNLALRGILGSGQEDATLVTTKIEHAAVREPAEAREKGGMGVVWLPLLDGGVVDVGKLPGVLAADVPGAATTLVSVQWANNETGVIQPVAEIAAAVAAARAEDRSRKIYFHVDATQAVGKLAVDVNALAGAGDMPTEVGTPKIDLLTCAAHKFHGPKGVGVLYLKRGVRLRPQQLGGPQELERRGGTENLPGILGMGVAAQQAATFLEDPAKRDAVAALRDRLETEVQAGLVEAGLPPAVVNSGGQPRLWNTTNLGFRGLEAEAVLLGLSERGVCASAGAACSSGSLEPSPVLIAMGVPEPVAHGSVRLSLSRDTTADEVGRAAAAVVAVVGRLAQVMPMGNPES